MRRPVSSPKRPLLPVRAVVWSVALLTLPGLLAPLSARAAPRTHKPAVVAERANVTLNFVNAEIEGVSRAMAAILERQIIVDPRVKGTITLYSDQPLTPREAYLNYLAALRGQGFTLVEVSGLLKVVPEAEAKLQTGTVAAGEVTRSGDQVMTQIFKLQHENANNMVTVLRPLISPNNTINASAGNNSLVITDYADNLQRIAKIIAAMDVPSSTDLEVMPLKYAIASDVAALVQKFADAGATGGAGGAQALTVLADARSNSLLVRAPNAARLALIRSVVDKLDKPGQSGMGGSGIYVVYLKNADATKLATVLRAAFASDARGGGSGSSSGSTSPSMSPPSATPSTVTPTGTAGGTSSGASTQSAAPVQASAAPSTGGFIQADPATNSLIITASDTLYRQLRAVIDQLDSRRAQIYVETMIVEMDADKTTEVGFQWQGLIGKNGDKNGIVLGTNSNQGANILTLTKAAVAGGTAASSLTLGAGLNVGLIHSFSGHYGLGALAQFLETKTDSNILSTPNLIALDNEEAKITVGQNVPFVTGTYTSNNSNSGSVNPFQTVERKDVGITLRVKPQIGENGTVRLTIYQENSSVVNSTSASSNGPTTNKSSIETNIVVDDGEVVVLGGLLKDTYSRGRDQVPGLGSLPVVGNLFRSENREARKTNLMVFLRPVVMRTQEASNSVTLDRYESIRAQQREMTPPSNVVMPINENPVLPALRTSDSLAIPATDGVKPVPGTPAPIKNAVVPAPGAASGSTSAVPAAVR